MPFSSAQVFGEPLRHDVWSPEGIADRRFLATGQEKERKKAPVVRAMPCIMRRTSAGRSEMKNHGDPGVLKRPWGRVFTFEWSCRIASETMLHCSFLASIGKCFVRLRCAGTLCGGTVDQASLGKFAA